MGRQDKAIDSIILDNEPFRSDGTRHATKKELRISQNCLWCGFPDSKLKRIKSEVVKIEVL